MRTLGTLGPRGVSRFSSSSWRAEMTGSLLITLVLVSIGAMLIQKSGANSAVQTIVDAVTRLAGNNETLSPSVALSIVSVWLVFAVTLMLEMEPSPSPKFRTRTLITMITASGAIAAIYWFAAANHAAAKLAPASATLGTIGRLINEQSVTVNFHYGFMLLLVLLLAACLVGEHQDHAPGSAPVSGLRNASIIALALGAAALIWNTHLKWSKAGAMDDWADFFDRKRQWPTAAAVSEAAIKITPAADEHYSTLGKYLIEQSDATSNEKESRALLDRADQVLETGGKLRPFNPSFFSQRGDLSLRLAQAEGARETKMAFGKKAIEFYQKAALLDPGNFENWYRLAYVDLAIFGSPAAADPSLLRALELNSQSHKTYGLLGDAFFMKGVASQNRGEGEAFFQNATTNYLRAISLSGGSGDALAGQRYDYTVSLGKSYVRLGSWLQAIDTYKSALLLAPLTEQWTNEETLARLFVETKDKGNATQHLLRAIELAPADRRPELNKLRNELLARP